MTTPHSIAEFTDPEVSPANNRLGTVTYASRYPDYTHVPAIIMKGHQFIHQLGFCLRVEQFGSDTCILGSIFQVYYRSMINRSNL